MKIPPYIVKRAEEAARAVGVAVFVYAVQVLGTWNAATLDDPNTALRALLAGAAPIIWATLRAALTPKAPPPAS